MKKEIKITMQCKHYWLYPYAIIEGRKDNEIAVIRYCHKCQRRQMAFASNWDNVPKNYDIEDLIGGNHERMLP